MIQNRVYEVDDELAKKIVQEAKAVKNSHVVEIYGSEIHSWEDYIDTIENTFKFPTSCIDSVDRYYDWMTDLDWLGKDSYTLVIHKYKEFLAQKPTLRKEIIDGFSDHVLPWWQEEVEHFVVDGRAKPFNVYVVV